MLLIEVNSETGVVVPKIFGTTRDRASSILSLSSLGKETSIGENSPPSLGTAR